MKRISILILVLCMSLVSTAWLHAQTAHKIVKFDVPVAGKGAGQGTVGAGIVDDGSIMGWYFDPNSVAHGYLRSADGSKFTKFDPVDSVNTFPGGMNSKLAIVGTYIDSSGVQHGFLRSPGGTITTFDDPKAGKGSGEVIVRRFFDFVRDQTRNLGSRLASSISSVAGCAFCFVNSRSVLGGPGKIRNQHEQGYGDRNDEHH